MRPSSRIWISDSTITSTAKKPITPKAKKVITLSVGASVEALAVGGHRLGGDATKGSDRDERDHERTAREPVTAPDSSYPPPPMSELEALLLGVVQGLTEFLPISSSGHLILVPWAQDYTFLQQHESFNKTFDVALHVGTLVAVLSYFGRELLAMAAGCARSIRTRTIESGTSGSRG